MNWKWPLRSLLGKTIAWLVLHLLVLGLVFGLFVTWQLGLGLDSLLSGATGGRLTSLAIDLRESLEATPELERQAVTQRRMAGLGLRGWLLTGRDLRAETQKFPANVAQRICEALPPGGPGRAGGPPPPGRPGGGRGGWVGPPGEMPPLGEPTSAVGLPPRPRPVFLLRGAGGDGYWAGVIMPLRHHPGAPYRPTLLVIRADAAAGGGWFFDLRPWLWAGLTVMLVSLLLWGPVVWRISRYLLRLTHAAESISAGNFAVSAAPHPHDELGQLGRSIERMAQRLDQLVGGQKRFLQNAAHELCAPLARLRTGLSVAETRLPAELVSAWQDLDLDAAELAALVDEILLFSRTGRQAPELKPTECVALLRRCAARDATALQVCWDVPETAVGYVDPALLSRAVVNVIRNAARHAGEGARLEIRMRRVGTRWEITCSDDGPGVPDADMPRLFEPFFRADASRSRDTGGFGLGLAIVKTSLEACGGSATAMRSEWGGLSVVLQFPCA